MAPDEELLARVDERTLALQKSLEEVKDTQTESTKEIKKTQEKIWDKLDKIEGKISEKTNTCPLGENRDKAHGEVLDRLATLETETSEVRGARKLKNAIIGFVAGAILTIVSILIGVALSG